ncbi:MAG TPA: hypothetical protein VHM31_16430 [Polyangia bacterium]|nr:hypothetical protein [Polyangia bacterium]
MLVTEILLSRTQAAVAEPVATAVLSEFPSADALAGADLHRLRGLLRPLGLQNKRASMLIACAQTLCDRFGGEVPRSQTKLAALPYVGPYAVDAVQCFAFRKRVPVVDINVARVYHRVFGLPEPHKRRRHSTGLRDFAAKMLPGRGVALFNWTLLDLGGVICTARYPKCELCPVRRICLAHADGTCGCRLSQNGVLSVSQVRTGARPASARRLSPLAVPH